MIGASVAIVAMAGLFVVFGLFRLGEGRDCGGHCFTCTHDCEHDVEGRTS